jgi:hypothetical protein
MKNIILKIFLSLLIPTMAVAVCADVPNYWLQAPAAYQMPKRADITINWRQVKKSDLPKECVEQIRMQIQTIKTRTS